MKISLNQLRIEVWPGWSLVLCVCQGEADEQRDGGAAVNNQTQRPPRRRFWRPYRRWRHCKYCFRFFFLSSTKAKLIWYSVCLGIYRPFYPRLPPDQSTDGQQEAAPQESQEQGDVKQAEASEGPQTKGEAVQGQGQRQRRPSTRRRQRTSESSVSKVSMVYKPYQVLWVTAKLFALLADLTWAGAPLQPDSFIFLTKDALVSV